MFGYFAKPGYMEHLEERRAIIARYKKLIKAAESKHEAAELRKDQDRELAEHEEEFKTKE